MLHGVIGKVLGANLSAGGTIGGDLSITGDLDVSGDVAINLTSVVSNSTIIDATGTEAFLVRKDSDGGDVFIVDTTNGRVGINGAPSTSDLLIKPADSGHTHVTIESGSVNHQSYLILEADRPAENDTIGNIQFTVADNNAVDIQGFRGASDGVGYLKLFVPSGVPIILLPLIVVIEIISYLSRPISLSVRLFANMMAGHTMMKVFGGFVISLGIIGGWLPLSFSVALTGLEILVAFLQAYVFAILTCIYLNDALNLHH